MPKVNETTVQIEKAFVERVMEKDWLDQTTKEQCVEKVNVVRRNSFSLIDILCLR